MRARQRSQAVVEFGLIALLFTALMFATVDFGLLLNTWLSVSSGTREIARLASVGKKQVTLQAAANSMAVPSVGTRGFSNRCCGPTSAIEVKVEYLDNAYNTIPDNLIGTPYADPDVDHTNGMCGTSPTCRPLADDLVRITVFAHGAQIITPLLRPFFGCQNGANPDCYVTLTSTATMRYEGAEY